MFDKKIKPGDAVRQKSTGAELLTEFSRHDIWVCQDKASGRKVIVSLNDIDKINPKKPEDRQS